VAMQEAPGLQGGGMGCRSGGKGQGLDEDRHTGLSPTWAPGTILQSRVD
jgi:hypothetical protein